ncbi:MAG: Rod binding domain-containing protein [Myxococcota bacterium]|jgi:Rod binding domain-containing protein
MAPLQAEPKASLAKSDDAKALQEFEAYFLAQILKNSGAESQEHMFDGGSAGRMYRDQMFDEISRVLSAKGGLGLMEQMGDALSGKAKAEETLPPEKKP